MDYRQKEKLQINKSVPSSVEKYLKEENELLYKLVENYKIQKSFRKGTEPYKKIESTINYLYSEIAILRG